MWREVYGKRTYKISNIDYMMYEERGVKNVLEMERKRQDGRKEYSMSK